MFLLCSWIVVVAAQDETVTVEITNLPEGVQNSAFEVTIAFSEAVVSFETGDIDFSDDSVDASVTELTTPDEGEINHKKVYTATITPSDEVSGDLTFQVAENVVKSANANADAEDNNAASDSHTVKVDLESPGVSITDVPTTVKLGAFEVIITFTEPVSSFEADDIQLTGDVDASVTNLTTSAEGAENHRIVWTAEITLAADTDTDGNIILTVPEDVAKDVVGHSNTASGSQTIWVDVTPPTVSITDVPKVEKNEAFDLTITFSEAVSGFDAQDITLTGPATLSLTAGSDGDTGYTVTITPDNDAEGSVSIQVTAGAATDAALNNNTASNKPKVHVDTIPPTVEINGLPEEEKNVAFDITITFSEAVNGFAVDDIILIGPATASLKSGIDGDSVYTAKITPNQATEGDVTFQVPANTVTDFARNSNEASTETDPVHVDTIPPTVEITGVPAIEMNAPFDITVTFSEAVNGFAAGDIILTGPAAVTLKSGEDGASEYTATITPDATSESDVTIQVGANTVKDFALNENSASNKPEVHIDTIRPTVEFITGIPTIEKNDAFDLTITFSEAVNGFQANNLIVTGPATASLKSGSDGDTAYKVAITPDQASEGDVTFQVPADAVTDFAKNLNEASTETGPVHIDTIPPTVEISNVPDIEKNEAFDITITFSEPIDGFQVGDISLMGPATVSLEEETGTNGVYRGTITPNQVSEGDVTFHIPAAIAQDFALNDNIVSDSHIVHIDTIPPTVTISRLPMTEQNQDFILTITFSEPVTGFDKNDLAVTGEATATATSGSGAAYSATITPNANAEGDVTIQVKTDATQDLAQNSNTASDVTDPVHIDTIPPTVEITGIPTIEQNAAFALTITFSEPVTGFDKNDLAVTGEATVTATSGSGASYTATITPNANAEGDVTIQVKAGATRDLAENNSSASDSHTVHIDTIPPTLTITSIPTVEKNVPFDITITFSEPVNGFAVGDITLTGPAAVTLESGEDGDSEYIASIAPDRDAEGDVTIQVIAGVVEDFAFNANTASNAAEVHVDTIVPTVGIIDVPHDVQLEMFSVTIAFSEDVLKFELADITLTGDAVVDTSELTGTGRTYTLTITPHEDTDGDIIIEVFAGVAEDAATNLNTAATPQTVSVAPKWIPDPNIRIVVREELGLDEGEDFARKQLTDLTTFNGFYREIMDLSGLEHATDLIEINLEGNAIRDLIALSSLTRLTTLNLNNNHISDIDSITNLTELMVLSLNGNRIDDLIPLTDLPKLKSLDLRENLIGDLQPLAALTTLTELDLTSNQIQDASPLGGLRNLVMLRVSDNLIEDADSLIGLAGVIESDIVIPSLIADTALKDAIREVLDIPTSTRLTILNLLTLTTFQAEVSGISDLTGLERATSLTTLNLRGNSITDITPLESLTSLTTLNLSDNSIIDITPLKNLTSLTTLNLRGNNVINITPLEGLTSLATLNLRGNSITDITPLEDLPELSSLNLSRNSIGNLDPLLGLIGLTVLEISGSDITNLNVISSLTGLRILDVSDNAITDITLLGSLERLTTLNLSGNVIGNLSVISQLTMLTVLKLNTCSITDLTPLADLTDLIVLEIGGNTISLLDSIITLTVLTALDLSDNRISDVKSLPRLLNLKTLRLEGNPILDTTPLYPLTQRVPPVDIDIAVSQYPPWDVNKDGRVNATDSSIVKAALGQSGDGIVNPRTDINGDGTVDNSDLRLVTNNFDDEVERAAPSIVGEDLDITMLRTLDRASLQAHLEELRAESDGSVKYQRAIALIAAFLAARRPEVTRLLANYPNPFNPETWIPYQLAVSSDVQIFIYDVRGAVIRHLKLGHQPAGYYIEKKHAAYWDGRNAIGESVASGIYFYQLQTDNISLLKEMVILK